MKIRGNRAAASSVSRTARGALRIVGGRWKRTVIPIIDARGLRPTPDRVRETVFNWLAHACGGTLDGLSAVDLFAGSGALGIEAASRGAAPVLLLEQNSAALAALHAVKARLDAEDLEIRGGDALKVGAQLRRDGRAFDLVFVDPPFASTLLDPALALATALCAPRGFIYAEAASPLPAAMLGACGLEVYRSDKAGDVFYHLLQRKITEEETPCLSPSTQGRSTL
jgi:16S rRNA (guanine(966)-N(2))-methyltransferase RsmD